MLACMDCGEVCSCGRSDLAKSMGEYVKLPNDLTPFEADSGVQCVAGMSKGRVSVVVVVMMMVVVNVEKCIPGCPFSGDVEPGTERTHWLLQ